MVVDGSESGVDEIEDGVEVIEQVRFGGGRFWGREVGWVWLEVDGVDGSRLVVLE